MKKLIIFLSILFTLILAGILYATYEQPGKVETVTADQSDTNQPPGQMPKLIPDPMVGFPLY